MKIVDLELGVDISDNENREPYSLGNARNFEQLKLTYF